MKALRTFIFKLLPLAGSLFPCAALAENFHIDLTAGPVFVLQDGYEDSQVLDHAISFSNSGFVYRLGGILLNDLETEGESVDSHLEIRGVYLAFYKELDMDAVLIELGGGAVFSETEAFILDRRVADERDQSPFLNVKVVKPINNFFALEGDWKYFDDLSGGDLHFVQAGVRFSF